MSRTVSQPVGTAEAEADRKIVLVQVDRDTLSLAVEIQQQIWPDNPPDRDYLDKVRHPKDPRNVTWLVYHKDKLIGLTGLFSYDKDEMGYDYGESVWMDWFAILPEWRRQGFGEKVLRATIERAQAIGGPVRYFRVDTADYPDRASTKLYDKVMQRRESYTAEPMPEGHTGLIYTFCLGKSGFKSWGNRLLDLGRYDAIEGTVH